MYDYSGLPESLQDGMQRYLEHGIRAGDFLTNVLSNDLSGAVSRADSKNINLLPDIVRWIYNEAPSGCWGSDIKVEAWLDNFKPVDKKQYLN